MKTDNYLTLCLEQAAKSPLHYRHGCIIVRGGKVIGQGYNDHRPGFNGGALTHGRISNGVLDGPAIVDLKEKLKKQKDKTKEKQSQQQDIAKPFVPFEGTGGGHHANVPLSMHSEMMAIHSALAASSTLSFTAFSCEKPCFKLPRNDKRKARLRRAGLAAYVDAVCDTSSSRRSGSLPQVLHHHGLNHHNEDQDDVQDEERVQEVTRRLKKTSLAFHERLDGEKHYHQKKKGMKEKKNQKDGYQYRYQYDQYGQQIQQQHGRQHRSASKKDLLNVIRGHGLATACDVSETSTTVPALQQYGKHKKGYKRIKLRDAYGPPQPEPLLLPKGHTRCSAPNLTDRKKHPRLNGADMYVARLGWCRNNAEKPPIPPTSLALTTGELSFANVVNDPGSDESLSSSTSSFPSTKSTESSGSLHEELTNSEPSPGPVANTCILKSMLNRSSVRASRPCYRCISYMHSVGIKRVFWTNDAGEWDGGKVRDLEDALDSSMESVAGSGCKGGPMGNGVFVTKHEMLMLKRMMG